MKKNFFDAADNLDAGSDEKQAFHFWGGLRQIIVSSIDIKMQLLSSESAHLDKQFEIL